MVNIPVARMTPLPKLRPISNTKSVASPRRLNIFKRRGKLVPARETATYDEKRDGARTDDFDVPFGVAM